MRLWGEIPTDVVIMLSYIVAKRFKSSTIISSTLETPTTHNLRERKKFKSAYEPSGLPGRNISHFQLVSLLQKTNTIKVYCIILLAICEE